MREEEKSLKPLFSKYLKEKNIIGFDIETHGNQNLFYSGGLYSNEGFKYFDNKDDLIEEILFNTPKNSIIVATNLMFDFSGLFFKTKYWNKFKVIMQNGRMLSAIFEGSNHDHNRIKIIMIDSLNFVPYSVAKMGEILGIPKLPHPKCLGKIPKNKQERYELMIYNKRDCEVTQKFAKFLQDGFLEMGAKFKTTVASTSMDLFRRKYLRKVIRKEKFTLQDDTVNDFMFKGYYGGRTEAFMRGKIKNLKMYDVNSLYPFSMLNDFGDPNTVKQIYFASSKVFEYSGMSDVLIESNESFYPELPLKAKVDKEKKLIFPNGEFRGVYNHVDINRAIEQGYRVKKIFRTIYYNKNFNPLKDYVIDLYEKRLKYKKEGSPMELLYKLALNSLYGKFAQHKSQDVKFFDINHFTDEEFNEFQNSDDLNTFVNDSMQGMKITESVCKQAFVFPMLSQTVTAHARNVINKFIRDGKAFYSDTDSIVTNKSINESKALGGMKVEYNILKGFIIKPKMYMFSTPSKEVVRIKGVSRVDTEKFLKVLRGQSVSFQKFSKLKESIRRDITPNSVIDVTKSVSLEDNKRVWSSRFNPDELQVSQPLNTANLVN